MLTPPTVTDAELPALSTQEPVLDWLVPSVEIVCGLAGPVDTPERVSVQLKVTVTSPLFHPDEFGEGEAEPDITGGVSSILIVSEMEFVSPAPSVALQIKTVPLVSAERIAGEHPDEESIPDSGSVTVQVTLTLTLFHPLMLAPGVRLNVMLGIVLSDP